MHTFFTTILAVIIGLLGVTASGIIAFVVVGLCFDVSMWFAPLILGVVPVMLLAEDAIDAALFYNPV